MKRNRFIQIKAAFLLIIFYLNTVIGFGCAIGLDMGFNHKHHHDQGNATIQKTSNRHDECCHHDEADNDHHKSKDEKDNCCNESVMKFAQVDKLLTQSFAANSAFFSVFISSYYFIDALSTSQVDKSIKYYVRSYHPPIPDIRIEIQSFQI